MSSYILSGHDNGKYAYDLDAAFRCEGCGRIDRSKSERKTFKSLPREVSSTYDNELIVSKRVHDRLCSLVDEKNFEEAGSYYYVVPHNFVQVDTLKTKLEYGQTCDACNKPTHVVGGNPLWLVNRPSETGIYATDIVFGDVEDYGSNVTPFNIVTEDVFKLLKKLNFKGLVCIPTNC
nr:hypothetical protein 7 [Gammaproteobacteria bacterium]